MLGWVPLCVAVPSLAILERPGQQCRGGAVRPCQEGCHGLFAPDNVERHLERLLRVDLRGGK